MGASLLAVGDLGMEAEAEGVVQVVERLEIVPGLFDLKI